MKIGGGLLEENIVQKSPGKTNIMKILGFKSENKELYPVGEHLDNVIIYIENISAELEKILDHTKCLNIWCRGSSGAILAALLASRFIYHSPRILHVKKEGEEAHSTNGSFNHHTSFNHVINIIIDDFVSSGETIRKIYSTARKFVPKIDVLIVHSIPIHRDWFLPFRPDTLIIWEGSISEGWNSRNNSQKLEDLL